MARFKATPASSAPQAQSMNADSSACEEMDGRQAKASRSRPWAETKANSSAASDGSKGRMEGRAWTVDFVMAQARPTRHPWQSQGGSGCQSGRLLWAGADDGPMEWASISASWRAAAFAKASARGALKERACASAELWAASRASS